MAESDFLSFLVDETLRLQRSGEAELSSLEHKLCDYGLSYLKGEFITKTQMVRFISGFGILDFPINWSIFNIENTQTDNTVLSNDNDKDSLFKVLRSIWNPEFETILVTHADGFCYFVGLKLGDENYLHDLLNPQEWLKAA